MKELILILFILLPLKGFGDNKDPLSAFKSSFGAPLDSGRGAKEMPFTALVNGYRGKDLFLKVIEKEKGIIEVKETQTDGLLYTLEDFLDETYYEDLKGQLEGINYLTIEEAKEKGISIYLDENKTSVKIDVPWEWLKPVTFRFQKSGKIDFSKSKRPDDFSGIINMFYLKHVPDGGKSNDTISSQANLCFKDINFYSGFNYTDNDNRLTRLETGMVFPIHSGKAQLWLGDINSQPFGIQAPGNISGIGLFSLTKQTENEQKTDELTFLLKNKSTVQIYKDEYLKSEIEADPGIFKVAETDLGYGVTTVRVVIKDKVTGEITEKIVRMFLSILSTPEGHFDYAVLHGHERQTIDREFRYSDLLSTYISGFYGVSKNWSSGFTFSQRGPLQTESLQQRVFHDYLSLNANIGGAQDHVTKESGYSHGITLSNGQMFYKKFTNIAVDYSYFSPGYPTEKKSSTKDEKHKASIKASWTPYKKLNLATGYSKTTISNHKASESAFINMSSSLKLSKKWILSISGGSVFIEENPDYHFFLGLTYSDWTPERRKMVSLQQTEKQASLKSQYNNFEDKYNLSSNLTHNRASELDNYNLQFDKLFELATFTATRSGEFNRQNGDLNLNFGTALAFTENAVTLTRPLNQSFVIVQSTNNAHFEIYDQNAKKIAESGLLKKTLIPMSSYSNLLLSASFTEPKYITNQTSNAILFSSGYITGTTYEIKANDQMQVSATLVDQHGTPIRNSIGKMECREKGRSFLATDKDGKFTFDGIRTDTCQINISGAVTEELDLNWPSVFKDFDVIEVKDHQNIRK